jgi:hypothetical protein
MFGIRPTRFVRRYCRTAVVWAAIPLAVFNGRTVVGCGCFGHFEAVCHCSCCPETQNSSSHQGESVCACCAGHGCRHSGHACCGHHGVTHASSAANAESHSVLGPSFGDHHCRTAVRHEVTPVTVASIADIGDLIASFVVSTVFNPSLETSQSNIVRVVDFDTGCPPDDLVVTLHRLVI